MRDATLMMDRPLSYSIAFSPALPPIIAVSYPTESLLTLKTFNWKRLASNLPPDHQFRTYHRCGSEVLPVFTSTAGLRRARQAPVCD